MNQQLTDGSLSAPVDDLERLAMARARLELIVDLGYDRNGCGANADLLDQLIRDIVAVATTTLQSIGRDTSDAYIRYNP